MAFDAKLLSGIGVFAAVSDMGNFTNAGAALGITGSGVSRAISRLEQRVGARLFERSPRAVVLTEEGQRFYNRVKPILEEAEAAASDLVTGQSLVTGRLRIAADAPSASLVLAGALAALRISYPQLSVEIVVRDTLNDLVSDGFDAALRFGDVEAKGLTRINLANTRILTAAAPALLASTGVPARPQDLNALPCVLMRDPISGSAYPWRFISVSGNLNVRAAGGILVSDGTTLLAACIEGVGFAQLLEIEARSALRSGQLLRCFEEWGEELYPLALYVSARSVRPARVDALIMQLQTRCRSLIMSGVLVGLDGPA